MKKLLGFVLIVMANSSYAGPESRSVGIAIGTEIGTVKAMIFVNESWSLNGGYYKYLYDHIRDAAQGYKHSVDYFFFGARRYWGVTGNTEFFVEGSYYSRVSNYTGNINSENNRQAIFGLYPGFEFHFNEKVSVAARAGLEYLKTTALTYHNSVIYAPVSAVELNYYF